MGIRIYKPTPHQNTLYRATKRQALIAIATGDIDDAQPDKIKFHCHKIGIHITLQWGDATCENIVQWEVAATPEPDLTAAIFVIIDQMRHKLLSLDYIKSE